MSHTCRIHIDTIYIHALNYQTGLFSLVL